MMEQVTMKQALISSLALAMVLGASAAEAVDLRTIDNFNEPLDAPLTLSPSNPPTSLSVLDTGLPPNSVIGGTRQTTLTLLEPLIIENPNTEEGGDNEFDETTITSGTGATGVLDQSLFSGIIGNFTRTTVTWNRGGTGLGQSFAGFDRFKLDISLFDLFNPTATDDIGTITLRVRNSLTGAFSSSPLTLGQIPAPSPDPDPDPDAEPDLPFQEFLFSGFSDPSVFNSSIAEIQLEIETLAQPGLLFTIGDLVAVPLDDGGGTDIPEPSLVLGCLTVAGTQLVITGWRKSRSHKNKH
jgi:hypothetical protein